jgi:DNA replication protein DnaC
MGNPTMTEELEQLLKNLKLRRMLEIYDEQLRAADKDDISYSEFVTRLVRAQWQARQEGALEWRIQRANLPERWSLETFPFARQPGVNRKQIRGFAELEFIAKAENIVLVGETGRGKTGLACGLLLKALENGTGVNSSRPRTCSMRCMHRWPTARRVNCSSAWHNWMF